MTHDSGFEISDLSILANDNTEKRARTEWYFDLNQEVANGIRYFGKKRTAHDSKIVTAEFVCHCGNAFRQRVTSVIDGQVKSCGCIPRGRKRG